MKLVSVPCEPWLDHTTTRPPAGSAAASGLRTGRRRVGVDLELLTFGPGVCARTDADNDELAITMAVAGFTLDLLLGEGCAGPFGGPRRSCLGQARTRGFVSPRFTSDSPCRGHSDATLPRVQKSSNRVRFGELRQVGTGAF